MDKEKGFKMIIITKVNLKPMQELKEMCGSAIEWEHKNLGRCWNEWRATVPVMGSIQETVDYVKGLENRPNGQGFDYVVLDDKIEFKVTRDSGD
jgi:hypothetical protein